MTVPGAGHMTPVEASRAVNDAVRRLVREHLAAGGAVPREALEVSGTPTDEEIVR